MDAEMEGAAMLGMLCSLICVRIATCWTRTRTLSLMSARAEGDVEDDLVLERPRLVLLKGPILEGSDEDVGGSPDRRDLLDELDSLESGRERGTMEDLEDWLEDWLIMEAPDERDLFYRGARLGR